MQGGCRGRSVGANPGRGEGTNGMIRSSTVTCLCQPAFVPAVPRQTGSDAEITGVGGVRHLVDLDRRSADRNTHRRHRPPWWGRCSWRTASSAPDHRHRCCRAGTGRAAPTRMRYPRRDSDLVGLIRHTPSHRPVGGARARPRYRPVRRPGTVNSGDEAPACTGPAVPSPPSKVTTTLAAGPSMAVRSSYLTCPA